MFIAKQRPFSCLAQLKSHIDRGLRYIFWDRTSVFFAVQGALFATEPGLSKHIKLITRPRGQSRNKLISHPKAGLFSANQCSCTTYAPSMHRQYTVMSGPSCLRVLRPPRAYVDFVHDESRRIQGRWIGTMAASWAAKKGGICRAFSKRPATAMRRSCASDRE